MTRTTFLRFTILQLAQSRFTDGLTFIKGPVIVDLTKSASAWARDHFWR
jgi:hypothetical protein